MAAALSIVIDVLNLPSLILGRVGLSITSITDAYQITSTQLKAGFACLLSMLLGICLARFLDIPKNQNAMYELLVREHDLERMLYQSSKQGTLVQITLKSRKVYIGLVFDGSIAPGIEKHEQFMLLPMLSGYRDKNSLCLELTNSYIDFYEGLDPDQSWDPTTFYTLILASEISSMAFYDPSAYDAIQSNLPTPRNQMTTAPEA